MSHFAGLFAMRSAPLPETRVRALVAGFPAGGGRVSKYEDGSVVLVHADYIEGRERGWVEAPDGSRVAALAGDLFLVGSPGGPEQREADLRRWTGELDPDNPEAMLAEAVGSFAVCHYSRERGQLLLATDSLGVRPIYWAEDEGILLFSTSFRYIAGMLGGRRAVDWHSVVEQAAFCYPLATRTLISGISVLRDGELLAARGGHPTRSRYVEWEKTELARGCSTGELAGRFHEALQAAVAMRAPRGGIAHTLLSGGLDSRCVAGVLLEQGRQVAAYNLSREGTKDFIFARAFADRCGMELTRTDWTREQLAETAGEVTARALLAASSKVRAPAVFSGDGGGETAGFLLMAPEIMELFAQGRVEEAAAAYAKPFPVSVRIVRPEISREHANAHIEGMLEEFRLMPGVDGQKAMQLFLLRNDSRRHLHQFFEYSERHTAELLLPYYDRRVVRSILEVPPPLDGHLRHRFYYEWLKYFKAPVAGTPWQTYKGQEPCPVPDESGTTDQWSVVKEESRALQREWRREALARAWGRRERRGLSRLGLTAVALADLCGMGQSAHHYSQYLWISEACDLAEGQEARVG